MALPPGLATVTVSGRVTRPGQSGTVEPLIGRFTFTPDVPRIVNLATGTEIIGFATCEPNGLGDYSVTLLAPDDPAISPTGWTYKVEMDFVGIPDPDPFHIALTKDQPAVNLTDLIPIGPTSGNVTGPAVVQGDLRVLGNLAVDGTTPSVDPMPHAARHAAGGSDAITEPQVANVLDFGAKADGASSNPTDNTPAFQAAHDSLSQGGVLYIPPSTGQYRLGSTVHISKGVTVRGGGWSPHFAPRTNMTYSYIRPATGNLFNGSFLFQIDPAPVNGVYLDSAYGGGPRIEGIAFHGRSANNTAFGTIGAIKISSGVKDVGIKNCTMWQFTGDAVYADNGAGMIFERITATTNGGTGFNITTTTTGGATDVDLIECYSQGNNGDGFVLTNPNAASLIGCRSEWNSGYGYNINGVNYSLVMVGCNTDRSGKHGFHVTTVDGGKPPLFVGCQAKRDGKTTGSWAGFNLQGSNSSTQTPGAILQGCSAYVGLDDDATGQRSPAYGIQTQFTRRVQLSGGWIEGTTAAYNDTSFAISKGSGVVQATVDPSTGTSTISNGDRMDINGASGSTRALRYFSRGSGQRWEARTESTNETGSNAGSNFQIARFSDAGTEIDVPMTIFRNTGEALFTKGLSSSAPALGMPTPLVANGYTAWSGDPELAGSSSSAATGGVLLLRALFIPRSTTLTKGYINLSAAATSPVAGQNWMGLYNSSGVLQGSVDITSQVTTTGHLAATWSSPITVTPGMYWMALLFNGTTNPAPYRAANALLASMNGGTLTASTWRVANNGTGQTALPSSFTPSANGQASALPYWCAVS